MVGVSLRGKEILLTCLKKKILRVFSDLAVSDPSVSKDNDFIFNFDSSNLSCGFFFNMLVDTSFLT